MQHSTYEGRDILRLEDIQGAQSMTNLKYRNIDQDKYVPEVLRHVPDQYQRQAELQKNIRNPHFNDFRYDMKQQHPQFSASSLVTDYKDSLDSFKQSQEAQKLELIRHNSNINYDFIRGQKNKNTFDKLNPPFANLHSDITVHQHENLSSPLLNYLKSTNRTGNSPTSINQAKMNIVVADRSNISTIPAVQNSHNPSPRNTRSSRQTNFLSQSPSVAKLHTIPSHTNPQQSYGLNNSQSMVNLNKSEQLIPYQQQQYQSQSQQSPQVQQQQQQQQQQMGQSQQHQAFNLPQMKTARVAPLVLLPNDVSTSMYADSPLNQYKLQSSTPSNGNTMTENSSLIRKTYKPYNIISNNRHMPYTPKFDLPDLKWDKYDRQMFSKFDQKNMPPVEIIRGKNNKMNIFSEYTTWNQKYGEINS